MSRIGSEGPKMQKKIFRTVSNTLRTVGLKASVDGDILTVAPVGNVRVFDLATAEGRRAWRLFFFAQKGRAARKRKSVTDKRHKRKPKSDLEIFRAAGLI
ncbi:MAG: hypothetical protein Q8M24_23460 [Pseudolabrys sp.]|nr:hypothetical protein [Pseudolabrys sp.]